MREKIGKEPLGRRLRRSVPYYVMLSPFLILFAVFMLVPAVTSVVLSLTDFNMLQMPHFVGFENYTRLIVADDVFTIALKNTLLFAVITGPIGYILSFVIAWLINQCGRRMRSLLSLMIYSPVLAGNVYFIWLYLFSGDRRGFLNNLLIQLGFVQDPIAWLADTRYNFACVVVVVIWMSFGAGFLSFIAGLQTLDRSLYEAAAIDGMTNRWQELYYVTLPQMGPQLLFGAVMSISSAFAVGPQAQALTGFPSTEYSTHTLLLHLIDYGTIRFEMGYASAIAVVLFGMMLLSWMGINRLLRKFL